jgi:hypothetical protein
MGISPANAEHFMNFGWKKEIHSTYAGIKLITE